MNKKDMALLVGTLFLKLFITCISAKYSQNIKVDEEQNEDILSAGKHTVNRSKLMKAFFRH